MYNDVKSAASALSVPIRAWSRYNVSGYAETAELESCKLDDFVAEEEEGGGLKIRSVIALVAAT